MLDVVVCNGLGIYLGIKTLGILEGKLQLYIELDIGKMQLYIELDIGKIQLYIELDIGKIQLNIVGYR